jgi:hypothetical protein
MSERTAALLERLDTARREFEVAIAATPEPAWGEPVDGTQTRTDLLAHIEWWERRGSYVIGVLLSGGTPRLSDESLDELNARVARESGGRTAAEVRVSEAGAWWELRTAVAALSERDLYDAAAFPWLEGEPLASTIKVESALHWADHLQHFG